MCQHCDKEVIEMGILESDLPGLPYKLVKWCCIVEGCKGATRLRDYGIAPLYHWAVKVHRGKDGSWRGGWTIALHGYICSRHFKEYVKNSVGFFRVHANTEQYLLSKIIQITKPMKSRPPSGFDMAGFT